MDLPTGNIAESPALLKTGIAISIINGAIPVKKLPAGIFTYNGFISGVLSVERHRKRHAKRIAMRAAPPSAQEPTKRDFYCGKALIS